MRKTLLSLPISIIVALVMSAQLVLVLGHPFINVFSSAIASQKKAVKLLFKNEKTNEDISYLQKSVAIMQRQATTLAILTRKLSVIVPLRPVVVMTDSIATATSQLPQLLGDGKEADFVLLFLNNYELRPGGGFIGSLGFITMTNYSITRFEVQDVYEIDGQITAHHEPHFAIRKYLNQPNEFLRDSNFSPYFDRNAKNALKHLSDVSGYNKPYLATIGITATAFEQLLQLTGPIELTDYGTIITSSNFFETTQRKIETKFFPGSKQKRLLLQSLGNVLKQRIEEISILDILEYLVESINSKNLVFFSPNPKLENFLVILGADGGRESAYKNWVMPIDANVGVNKMNALVHKTMDLRLIRSDKTLTHTFRSTYTNNITADAQIKESYKNYFQLYVPRDAILKKASLDNINVIDRVVTSGEGNNSVFAIYFEIPPATSSTITIVYDIPHSKDMRSIEFQKQIGSKPSPLTLIYEGKVTEVEQRLIDSDEVFNLL